MAGICIALAGLQLLMWMKSRDTWPYLLFSITALGGAGLALLELALMQSQSPAQFSELWRWYHVALFVLLIALVWFVRFFLQAGRLWLAWLITGLRVLVLILTFSLEPNLNFIEITSLRTIPVLGETVVVPVGEKNPWTNITNASSILILLFVLDAALSAWRSGARRRAAVVGVSFGTAIMVGIVLSEMLNRGILPVPFTLSVPFLIVLMGVAYELSAELTRVNQLARELLETEKRLSLATSGADIGVWDWDIERDEVWATDTIRQRIGLKENESLRFNSYFEKVHPDDRDAFEQVVRDALHNSGDFDVEYRLIGANDEQRWIRARGRVECGPTGKPLHMRGVSLDITERKRAEAELHERRHELAHAARVSSMGQLSSALAHELSQPLAAILRNAEAAELFLGQNPPDLDEVRAILEDIRKDDERAASVIERMRSLLKRRELRFETLAVGELIEEVAQLLHAEVQARRAIIRIDVPPTLPMVQGDRVHLQQVILNLLLNSLDAMEGLMKQQRQIFVRASQAGEGMVEVAVIDNGSGITPEKEPHLFEPFFTTKIQGTGIGLAITKTIIELHGGRITAENNPEDGATVRFMLKAVQEIPQE
jgi:signal transduction histidine kinase